MMVPCVKPETSPTAGSTSKVEHSLICPGNNWEDSPAYRACGQAD